MLDYLIKSGAILAILFLFYKLVLENAQMHNLKRGFLLFSLLAAFGIPLLVFTNTIYVPQVTETFVINEVINLDESAVVAEKTNYLGIILMTIYGIGVFLFGAKFLINLFYISKKIHKNPHHKRPPFTEVLLPELTSPYTFFNYIFLNKYKFESKKIPKEVIWHEEAHARQKHSIDVLFIEAIQVVFWFNPFLHFIKKSVKLNHEFLADEAVLNKGIPAKTYQQTILNFSSTDNYPQLSNALNYKPIKKRFTQMKTKTTKKAVWIKSLLILPLLAILIYSFSQKETRMLAQTVEETANQQDVLNQAYSEGATVKMMEEYREFIKKSEAKGPNGQPGIIRQDQLERARAIYAIMNIDQRSEVKDISVIRVPSINLSKVTPIAMTSGLFEKLKDRNTYAIWIDGKHMSNTDLDNYQYKDFKHYIGSRVMKNARSKKFPQPFQFNLFTKKGFEHTYLNAQENKLKKLTAHYNEIIKESDDESTKRIYQKLIELQREKVSNSYQIKTSNLISDSNLNSHNPNSKHYDLTFLINAEKVIQFEDGQYTLATIYHAVERYIKDKNLMTKYDYLEGIIIGDPNLNKGFVTDLKLELRKTGKIKRTFQLTTSSFSEGKGTVKEYQEKNKIYEKNRQASPHFKDRSEAEKQILVDQMSELGGLYFRLSAANKKLVKRPIGPLTPYVRFTVDGKEIYKLKSELTEADYKLLPPPPPPAQKEATPEQMATYNRWAKKYNAMLKTRQVYIKLAEVNHMKAIYAVMSTKQKKSAEPFPNIPSPPPPPPAPGVNGTNPSSNPASPKQLVEYNKLAKKYNAPNKLGYPHIKEKDFKKMEAIYAVMSMKQKRSAVPFPPPPPPPPVPVPVANEKNPPPPPPPNPTDHMIELAKKGAEFYHGGKKISSDRAIELTKMNGIHVNVKEVKGKKPVVKLYFIPNVKESKGNPVKTGHLDQIIQSEESAEIEEIIEQEIEIHESPRVEEEREIIEVVEEIENIEEEEVIQEEVEVSPGQMIGYPKNVAYKPNAIKGYISYKGKPYYYINEKNKTTYYDKLGKEYKMPEGFIPKTGWVFINGETFYFSQTGNKRKYFNRFGKEADAKGVLLK